MYYFQSFINTSRNKNSQKFITNLNYIWNHNSETKVLDAFSKVFFFSLFSVV